MKPSPDSTTPAPTYASIAFIGFGEVAAVMRQAARRARWEGTFVACFADKEPSSATVRRAADHEVPVASFDDAMATADLAVSVVTPAAAVPVARFVADRVERPLQFLDLNSIGPDSVSAIGDALSNANCGFVKGAILGPVPLMREAVPLALGGKLAAPVAAWLRSIGFQSVTDCRELADPARLKMLWSVVTKGVIPLYAESLIASERMGLLGPLTDLMRDQLGFYGDGEMILRLLHSSIESGLRRIDEMNEAAAALVEVGVPARSHAATVAWLADLAALVGAHERAFGDGHGDSSVGRSLAWLSSEFERHGRDA